jgi:TRAP-type C4-dicarboxylate transport system permease small subunit
VKVIRAADRALAAAETGLLVVFLGSMVLLAFVQVLLRNITGEAFVWGDTIVRHCVLWAGFIGGALAAFEGRHIGIDAITKFLSPLWRSLASVLTNLFGAVVSWYLAEAAWRFVMDERAAGGDLVLSIPTWVAMIIIPAGYGLIAVHFALKVLENGADALHGGSREGRT